MGDLQTFRAAVNEIQEFCQRLPPHCFVVFSHNYYTFDVELGCKWSRSSKSISIHLTNNADNKWFINNQEISGDIVSVVKTRLDSVFKPILQAQPPNCQPAFSSGMVESRKTLVDLLKNVFAYEKCKLRFEPCIPDNTICLAASSTDVDREIHIVYIAAGYYEINGERCALSRFGSVLCSHLIQFQRNLYITMQLLLEETESSTWDIHLYAENNAVYVVQKGTYEVIFAVCFDIITSLCDQATPEMVLRINGSETSCISYIDVQKGLHAHGIIAEASFGRVYNIFTKESVQLKMN